LEKPRKTTKYARIVGVPAWIPNGNHVRGKLQTYLYTKLLVFIVI
jgi:hypothetical protein